MGGSRRRGCKLFCRPHHAQGRDAAKPACGRPTVTFCAHAANVAETVGAAGEPNETHVTQGVGSVRD